MILLILGIIDIIAGICLALLPGVAANGIVHALAWFILIKGAWSVVTSAAQGYFWDWMGWVDAIVGATIVLAYYGMLIGIMQYIWWVIVLKGVYTMLCSVQ